MFYVQGYPQRMRLQKRLYGISLVCFLTFRVPCKQKPKIKIQNFKSSYFEFWVVFTVLALPFLDNPIIKNLLNLLFANGNQITSKLMDGNQRLIKNTLFLRFEE